MMKRLLIICLILSTVGCSPRVRVTKVNANNSHVDGIRYYRPKPYLLLTPFNETKTVTDSKKNVTATTTPGEKYVNISLEYLPDFSEEYAVQVRTGLGRADVDLELEDGWKLVSLNQDIESKFDENVKAISDLAGTVLGATVPTPAAVGDGRETANLNGGTHQWVVKASNVPLGYYESVIGLDECGNKQMYGWRYLGFMPFGNCPPNVCGRVSVPCGHLNLYGLVFRNGVMEFRQIGEIESMAAAHLAQEYVPAENKQVAVTRNFKGTLKEDSDGPEQSVENTYQFQQQVMIDESRIQDKSLNQINEMIQKSDDIEITSLPGQFK